MSTFADHVERVQVGDEIDFIFSASNETQLEQTTTEIEEYTAEIESKDALIKLLQLRAENRRKQKKEKIAKQYDLRASQEKGLRATLVEKKNNLTKKKTDLEKAIEADAQKKEAKETKKQAKLQAKETKKQAKEARKQAKK